jgi:RNA polymerase sigma factor for flagellar operon FliA
MNDTSLWTEFASGRAAARASLLEAHLGLVHHVARQVAARLNGEVELDELISAGTLGLMQALAHFDTARGLSFSTFAVPRIRGAILDELRRQDHVPRSIRRKTRDITSAKESLGRALGRAPSDGETARLLGVPDRTLRQWQVDIEGGVRITLDRTAPNNDSHHGCPSDVLADSAIEIDDVLTRQQEVGHLQAAIMQLKEQERTVLALHYFEELKLQAIADVLGLSACRISQIRSAALRKLRLQLSSLRAA